MAQNHDFKLDLLSKIDEKMVDKVTLLRAKLTRKPRMKRKTLWTVTSIAASFLLIAGTLLALLPMLLKQVPVYTGMTVSNKSPFEVAYAGEAQYEQLAATGKFEGDHDGKEKKPSKNPSLRDEVEDTLKVEGAAETLYYANPKEDIYITVHISNPDKYEILSFTLNGEKYSSYMFEDGSDMENLVLKVNVGDVEGIVEYTIDAIKYVDGTQIKDVKMEGDQTVKVGIKPKKGISTKIEAEKVDYNTISMIATVADRLKMIELSGGKAEIALYTKSGELVETKDLPLNSATEVVFDGLHPNTEYQYALVAHYDNLEGKGFGTYVLQQKAIVTDPGALFGSVEITQEEISFALVWNKNITNQQLTSLTLYRGEEKVEELAADATKVSGLLSGVEYRLVAEYDLEGKNESSMLTFTTVAKTVPEIMVDEAAFAQTAIPLIFADPDHVGSLTKVELLKDGTVIQTLSDFSVLSFEGLEGNTAYQIKVAFTYDLNDGNGTQNSEVIKDVATMPQPIEITNATFLGSSTIKPGESVILRVSLSNPDQMEIQELEINGNWVKVLKSGSEYQCAYKSTAQSGKETLQITKASFLNSAGKTSVQNVSWTLDLLLAGEVTVKSFYADQLICGNDGDSINLTVVFNGSEAYEIHSITCKINSYDDTEEILLTKVSDTVYTASLLAAYEQGARLYTIQKITFKDGKVQTVDQSEINGGTVPPELKMLVWKVNPIQETAEPISTPEDLQNMQMGGSYRLVNDIDLSGVNWVPYNLEFVSLDGNGFVIKNLSLSETQQGACVGLFAEAYNCYFHNVVLENVGIILWGESQYGGLFAGRASTTIFEKCSATGNIQCADGITTSRGGGFVSTSADNNNNGYYYYGGPKTNLFLDCTYEGWIFAGTRNSAFYGGGSNAYLIRCTSRTNVPLWYRQSLYPHQVIDCTELPYEQ